MIDEYINILLENSTIQAIGLAIGIISGTIAIFQYLLKKEKLATKKEINRKKNIKYNVKSICVDCNSILSKNSSHCIACGSADPFNIESYLDNIDRKLSETYEIFVRISGEYNIIYDIKKC